MLKAHLNPDINAASGKEEFINESVEWIAKCVMKISKTNCPI